MNNDYLLFMDVSGDIDTTVAEQGQLNFIPMSFLFGGEETVYSGDKNNFDVSGFYEKLKLKTDIKTSQITPIFYEEFFKPYISKGQSIIYLCLSSGLSSTFSSANVAAEALKQKYPSAKLVPIDTVSATCGMGLLAEKMIENKLNGLSIDENAADLEKTKNKITMFCYVGDLMYLKRGGRIGATTAIVGSMLNIKPLLKISPQGTLAVFDKKIGVKKSIKTLGDIFNEKFKPQSSKVVYIVDSAESESAELMANELKSHYPDCIIKRTSLSPIIGAHLGPGAVVLGFYID